MLPIVNLVLGTYLIWRCLWTLTLPRQGKLALAMLLMGLIEHHWLVSRLFGTSIASPEIPGLVLMGLGAAYGTLLLLAVLTLCRDAIGLLLWLPSHKLGRMVLRNRRTFPVLLALSLISAIVGVMQAVKVPAVKTLEITLPGLPEALDGYRMVHLTDLHISRLLQRDWVQAVVDNTNALTPDVIVFSGDLVDGTPEARANDIAPLAQLSARDGVFAVSGNHEYYADYADWMHVFGALGIVMLENRHVMIQAERGGFVLAGVPDRIASSHGQPGPDTAKALAGQPVGLPVVLLDHRPGNILRNQPLGVDLQLSGHTHGGHIRGLDLIVKRFNEGFVSGRYQVGNAVLYVGNGAGLWPGFPLRLGRASDITHIILRANPAPHTLK